MFTKNWYAILAAFALNDTATGTFKGVDKTGIETAVNGYPTQNTRAALSLYDTLKQPQIASMDKVGVFFGTGNTAPTLDDYCLSGNVISSNFTVTYAISGSPGSDGNAVTAVYTLVDNGSTDVTVGEIAMVANNGMSQYFIIERTALETPITIPAGGVGKVTYTIDFKYPTA